MIVIVNQHSSESKPSSIEKNPQIRKKQERIKSSKTGHEYFKEPRKENPKSNPTTNQNKNPDTSQNRIQQSLWHHHRTWIHWRTRNGYCHGKSLEHHKHNQPCILHKIKIDNSLENPTTELMDTTFKTETKWILMIGKIKSQQAFGKFHILKSYVVK